MRYLFLLFLCALSALGLMAQDSIMPPPINQQAVSQAFTVDAKQAKYLQVEAYFPITAPAVLKIESKFSPPDKTLLFYFCMALMLYLAILKTVYSKYFYDVFNVFFRSNLKQKSLREQLAQNSLPALLLNVFFCISGGMFLNLMGKSYGIAPYSFWLNFALATGLLMSIYLLKYITIHLNGWLFQNQSLAKLYAFLVFLVIKIMGIVLLPAVLIMALGYPQLGTIIVTATLMLLAFLVLYRVVQASQLVKSSNRFNPFHFFVYLCAFEIMPLAILVKVAYSSLINAA